jgi:hypothetical protein
MKTVFRIIPVLGLVLACAGIAFAQGPGGQTQGPSQPWMQFEKELGLQTTYSCDMAMQMMGRSMDSRIVRDGGKTRTEMTMPMMNLKMVGLEIPEGGKSVSYSLFPDKKKYVLNEDASGAVAAARAAKPQIEELGTETYEGVACVKRRVTMVQQDIRSEMTMLFSPMQKNMPVKMTMTAMLPAAAGRPAMPMQSTILFKNYDFSTPAAALFAIPADYVKAPSMQAIMRENMPNLGAMMKQMQPPAQPAK